MSSTRWPKKLGSLIIGGLVNGADPNEVLFVDDTKSLEVDSVFQYDNLTGTLAVPTIKSLNGAFIVDLTNGALRNNSDGISVDWSDGQLYDASGTLVLDWGQKFLYDVNGSSSLDWSSRTAFDNSGNVSIDWDNRVLRLSNFAGVCDWNSLFLADSGGAVSVDWGQRILRSGAGSSSIDWNQRQSYDSSQVLSIDYGVRKLYATNGTTVALDWSTGDVKTAGHFLSTSALGSTTAGGGAGTSPTLTVTGSDVSGLINLTTGTGPSGTNATICTINFGTAYGANVRVLISPASSTAAALSGATQVFTTGTTTQFVLKSGTSALAASTNYQWYFSIIG